MKEVDPVRVISKARNNRLMEYREQMGFTSCMQFAKWLGMSYGLINEIESLKRYPSLPTAQKIADKLGASVEELFPTYLRNVKKRESAITIPEAQMLQLADVQHLLIDDGRKPIKSSEHLDLSEHLERVLNELTPTEERVIKMRFGFDGPEMTLAEVAAILGLSTERIRQIEARALRKLRHPSRTRLVRDYADGVDTW